MRGLRAACKQGRSGNVRWYPAQPHITRDSDLPWDRGLTRQAKGYGAEWQKARKLALARDSYLCQPCLSKGRPTEATQVDHITPKAKGGTDDLENLQSICDDCHKAKTALDSGYSPRQTVGLDGWPV